MKIRLQFYRYALTALVLTGLSVAQEPTKKPADPTGRENAPFSRNEADLPKGPAPRLGEHPDLSGYWVPSRKDKPVGNLGKDLPAYKLPFTTAGQEALKYNVEHTIDPEALCIVGGLPRHNASGLPFQLLQGADHTVFLYWYTTYRLVPFDGRKHSEDPDPSFFGEEIGSWDGDTFVIDSIAFKEKRTWLLGKPGDEVREYSCSEDNVDASHLYPGPGPIGSDGQRGYEKLAPPPPPPSKDHPAVTSIPE